MAIHEHVAILKKGVKAWNSWRDPNNLDLSPDLSGAKFIGEDLRYVDFRYTDLSNVDFSNTYLFGADFSMAHLDGTNFTRADLREAIFRMVSLKETNFSEAWLSGTIFSELIVLNAVFSDSIMEATRFVAANLRTAQGLDTIRYNGPSSLGIDTLFLSGDVLSKKFLRGCGIPDNFVEYFQSLIEGAIQYYSCFISYSSSDELFVRRLHTDLQDSGVRCWFASEDMKIGEKIRPTIDRSIRINDKLLLILSANSIKSPWVEKEVETAFEEENRRHKLILFPIQLDDAILDTSEAWASDIRRTRHIGDFRKWKEFDFYQRSLNRLLADLKQPPNQAWCVLKAIVC